MTMNYDYLYYEFICKFNIYLFGVLAKIYLNLNNEKIGIIF